MKHLLLAVSWLAFWACNEPAPAAEPRNVVLAKSICKSTEQLLALNEAARTAPDSLDFRRIANAFDTARLQVQSLGISPEERPAVEQALQFACPELYAQQELLADLLSEKN